MPCPLVGERVHAAKVLPLEYHAEDTRRDASLSHIIQDTGSTSPVSVRSIKQAATSTVFKV